MSVPRTVGEGAQGEQPQQTPPQASALGAPLQIPVSHAFIPFQQFSLTPTEAVALRNPSDDNNNKSLPVVAQQQQQQLSVVTAVPSLCPPLPVHSMQQAVVGGAPTIIPAVVTPMTVQAAAAAAAAGLAPSTTMPMSTTLNLSNHLPVAAAVSTTAQQQYQTLGSTAGLNLMASPALGNPGLSLASSAAVASAINTFNNSILANTTTNTPFSNHSSPSSSSLDSKSSSKNSSNNINHSNNNKSSSSTSQPTPNNSSNAKTPNSKSGSSSKTSSSPSSNSSSSAGQQNGSNSVASAEGTDDLVKPVFKDGELVLEVECGQNKGILYLSKLCQGSKGPCISFQTSWLTPNEFQFVSGRETAKDWKRSIRHHGKSLKLLLAKGILNVHPTMCDCDGCRQGATLTRKGEKRRIPNGDRKPRKPSGGNAGNGSSAGHAGTGAGTAVFRSVGGVPTVASHLASPGGALAKQETKRSGGDKQIKITQAAAPGSSEPQSQSDAELTAQDLKSQASAYLDSFNMLGAAHKPRQVSNAPLKPLELTSPSTEQSGGCQLTPQSQNSPALSSPASSTSSRSSSLCSPAATNMSTKPQSLSSARQDALGGDVVDSLGKDGSSKKATEVDAETTSSSHMSGVEVSTKEADVNGADAVGEENKDDVLDSDVSSGEDSDDEDAMNEDEAAKIASDPSENSKAEVEKAPDGKEDSGKESMECDAETETESKNVKPDEGDGGDDQEKEPGEVEANGNVAENKPHAPSVSAPDQTTSVSVRSPVAPPKPHPYGISAILGAQFTSSSAQQVSMTTASVTDSYNQALNAAAVSGSCTQPLSVSVYSNNVKSEHIWVPPTLSPAGGDASGNSHSRRSSSEQNHSSSKPSFKSPSSSSANGSFNHQHYSPTRDHTNNQHGLKLTKSPLVEKSPLKREHCPVGKSETSNIGNTTSSNHAPSTPDKHASSRDSEREERQKQRAREERNRKDREREERRERERREEKEAERRRQEEKERRAGHSEGVRHEGSNSAAPGVAATADPSRRPPGGIADAAAFSDYMRVLAAGHGHPMMPPTPGYMPSLYGLRPQDSATASALHSQLFHPMAAMYGPAATAAAGGLPKDASSLLFPGAAGALAGLGASPFASLHPLLAARQQYAGAGPTLLDYQRSLAAATASSSSASASNPSASPYATWPAAAYPYLLPELMAASSSQAAAAAAAAGVKRHSSEMEAAMEMNAKRMRLEGRPAEYASPWEYFAVAAAASQHNQQQQQHFHQQQQQQQQQQRAAAAYAGHPALSCGLESSASMDKKTAEYLSKRYLEYAAASSPHAAAYLSAAMPDYARTMSLYGQATPATCPEHRDQDIRLWGVDEVCKFLVTLEGCGIYAEHFREQRVDGRILSLLSSEHLVKALGMKLGPALLLAENVAKRLQELSKMAGCEACRAATLSNMQAMQALHPMMSLPM